MSNILKILMLNAFSKEYKKLWSFLTKLNLYIDFNQKKFNFKMNKYLYIIVYLKNAAFNWVNFKLHKFLNKSLRKCKVNKKSIFSDFKKFKKELWKTFKVIDEKRVTKQQFYILKINKLAVKYSVKFQCIAVLTDWDNDVLVLQYYWKLNKSIKDKIV